MKLRLKHLILLFYYIFLMHVINSIKVHLNVLPKAAKTPKPVGKVTSKAAKSGPNKYKFISLSIIEGFHEDTQVFKKATPIEWVKNKSEDIPKSIPILKTAFQFIKGNLLPSLQDKSLSKQCKDSKGILNIQKFLKKNLLPGPAPKKKEKPQSAAAKQAAKDNAVKKAKAAVAGKKLFIEATLSDKFADNVKKNLQPFGGILKYVIKFQGQVKAILSSPLMDRIRYILNWMKYTNKKKKTKDQLQLTITNFTANLYKCLDKGLEEFIERVVASYCDKDKGLIEAVKHFDEFLNEKKDQEKKYKSLGKCFVSLIKAFSK